MTLVVPEQKRLIYPEPRRFVAPPAPPPLISRRDLLKGGAAAASAAYIGLQPERVRAQSPCGSFFPTVPPPAAAVGYNTLVFADDFNLAGTIGTSGQASGTFNWYDIAGFGVQPSNRVVSTTMTASQVANGNASGAGPNASPLGGILTISGPATGGNNATIISTPSATHVTSSVNNGAYQHAYWEFYAQFDPNYVFNGDWYAIWFFSQFNVPYQNGSLNFTQIGTEVDLREAFCGNFQFPAAQQTASGKQWTVPGNGSPYLSNGSPIGTLQNGNFVQTNADANWHTIGLLWVGPNGSTPGYAEIYQDNVAQAFFGATTTKNTTGKAVNGQALSGTVGWQWIENAPLYMQMGGPPTGGSGGAGLGLLNIDWVRVWKSSYAVP